MRTPWTIQQIEPEVWAIVDADGDPILTLGKWEVAEGEMVVEVVNGLAEALEEIAKGEGPYSRDRLTHATNVIEHMQQVARGALAKVRGEGADDD